MILFCLVTHRLPPPVTGFKNSTRPKSALKKKHNAVAHHRTREAIAAGIIRVAWEDGRFNLADVLTKLLAGPKLRDLVSCILH